MAKIPRITDQPRPVAPPRLLWRPGVRSIGTPQPLKLPLTQSPRLNATEAGVKPIRVYRIVSPSGERLIDAATLGSLLNYNQVFRARDGRAGGEYYVQRELIEQKGSAALEHAQNIYHFGRDRAINFMEMRAPQTSGGPAIGRALFQEVEAAILERSSPHNLVHLSYMLHEAAERGGDFLLAAALLLHNTELNLARTILTKGKKTGTARAKMVGDILEICALLQRLRLYRYEHHAGQVHETVDSVIKLARGDWRVLLI